MAIEQEIPKGDDWTIPVQLLGNNDQPEPINIADTVTATLIELPKQDVATAPITVLHTTSGSDWSQGILQIKLDRNYTINLQPKKYNLEIAADGTEHRTWRILSAVVVVKTFLND